MRKFEVGCVYKRLSLSSNVPYMYVYKRKGINAEVVSLYDRYLMRADEVVEDADL